MIANVESDWICISRSQSSVSNGIVIQFICIGSSLTTTTPKTKSRSAEGTQYQYVRSNQFQLHRCDSKLSDKWNRSTSHDHQSNLGQLYRTRFALNINKHGPEFATARTAHHKILFDECLWYFFRFRFWLRMVANECVAHKCRLFSHKMKIRYLV